MTRKELLYVKLVFHHVIFEKAVVFEAIYLDQCTITWGNTVIPLPLVDSTVSLQHSTSAVSFVVQEITFELHTSWPSLRSIAAEHAILNRSFINSLLLLFNVTKESDSATSSLTLLHNWYGPVSLPMLAPFFKVASENAAIVPNHLAVALR